MSSVCNSQPVGFIFIDSKIAKERKKEIEKKIWNVLESHISSMSSQIDLETNSFFIKIGYNEGSREKVIAFMQEKGLLSQNSSNQYFYKEVPVEFESGTIYPCNISYQTAENRMNEILKTVLKLKWDELSSMAPQFNEEKKSHIICIGFKKGNRERIIALMQEQGWLSQHSPNQYFYKEVPVEFEVEDMASAC
jgi:hypothetical protein